MRLDALLPLIPTIVPAVLPDILSRVLGGGPVTVPPEVSAMVAAEIAERLPRLQSPRALSASGAVALLHCARRVPTIPPARVVEALMLVLAGDPSDEASAFAAELAPRLLHALDYLDRRDAIPAEVPSVTAG